MILLLMMMLAASPAGAQGLDMDINICRAMALHLPDAGVVYKPGVDVHGNPVVGADLNPSPMKLPENFSFDITVDVMQHMGVQSPEGLEGKAPIGRIDVQPDGRMFFNGQPLEGEAEAALRGLCKDKQPPAKQGENSHKHRLLNPARGDYNR